VKEKTEPLIVHVHIPKCAGTTFRREIVPHWLNRNQYRLFDRVHIEKGDQRRKELKDQTKRESLRLISGHDVYGIADDFGRDVETMTFLRDPFERQISLWSHHKHRSSGILPEWQYIFSRFENCSAFVAGSDVMYEFWHSFLTGEEQDNLLITAREGLSARRISMPDSFGLREIGYLYLRDELPELYERVSDLAKSRLNSSLCLLASHFDESLVLLNAIYGAPLIKYKKQRIGRNTDLDYQNAKVNLAALRTQQPLATQIYNSWVSTFFDLCNKTEKFSLSLQKLARAQ